jgi:hypothetical protein
MATSAKDFSAETGAGIVVSFSTREIIPSLISRQWRKKFAFGGHVDGDHEFRIGGG